MSQEDDDWNRIEKACVALGEYFDSVHIFATRHEEGVEGGTVAISFGSGNWFARRGQIRDWSIKKDEIARQETREKHE